LLHYEKTQNHASSKYIPEGDDLQLKQKPAALQETPPETDLQLNLSPT
jgi:hypothetical protein